MSNEETAVQTASLTPEEIQAVLSGQGVIDEESEGFGAIRMKGTGNTFQTEDDVWVYNPKTDEPAFTARLMSAPVQYQAKWFTEAEAERAGRPEIADRFCKSHYDIPSQSRERSESGASCRACPFNPFGDESKKCQWRGDLSFQIIPDEGHLTGDEPIHMISLPVTGMIEWKGTRRAPMEGSATKRNFMAKLADLSIRQAEDWGVNERQAIIVGLEALNEGMVAAEFRLIQQTNEEQGRTWSVVSLTPIHVQKPEAKDAPAIEAGDEAKAEPAKENEFDDLPF
jgi:hypothetical protein